MSAGAAATATAAPGEPGLPGEPANGVFSNRFLLVTVASRREAQIRGGARVRVERGIHKPAVLAVAEVLAGWVPYSLAP